jgi:hypothetical protein
LRVRRAHSRRRSVLLERCQAAPGAARLKLVCLPLRRVGARGQAAHGPVGMRPSVPARNSAPCPAAPNCRGFAPSPDFDWRVP